jgi:ABC-type transport system involved in cytochrome c biogenesis permease subunit
MSTGTWPKQAGASTRAHASSSIPYAILKALGSLKITVTMFALGIFIILFGTLAQDELDLAEVKREFFNCWIARIPFDVLFPTTLFPHDMPYFGGFGFYFPGGAAIGLILLINLIAAKTTRFSVSAKGGQLWGGIVVALLGTGLVTAVIVSGHATDGLQGKPPISYDQLWDLMKGGFIVLTLALAGYAMLAKLPPLARILVGLAAVLSFAISALLLSGGEAVRLDNPGLRIVWQLLQASIASCVVLAGLWMIFGKRGGNVLIHAGVGLLMVGQFVFGDRQVEQRIGLTEGATTNLAVIEDEIEIVLIDTSDETEDVVYALPESLIRRAGGTDRVIDDPELPCKLRIVEWMKNSSLAPLAPAEDNPATTGNGLKFMAKPLKPLGAAVMDARNIAAAYVEVIDKQTDEPIDTVLLSQEINDIAQLTVSMQNDEYEAVTIDGKPFELAIRFRQERKPFDVHLKDVERMNYSGTETARDYSSRIVITDRETGESQEGKTWMNNPIRYKGETFYQSRYNKIPLQEGGSIEATGLQVVENAGWVIPYVSCMMVFWGMAAHFGGTFLTFASRYSRGSIPKSNANQPPAKSWSSRLIVAGLGLGFCALIAGYFAKPESRGRNEIDWAAVSKIPVQHEGRIKPFDSVARNLLQFISKPIFGNVPYVKDEQGVKRSPSEWLLGVMAGQEWVRKAEVFRAYAPEVRAVFDLEPRKGYRYSYVELEKNLDKFREEIDKLRGKDPDSFDFREQKLAAMHQQLNSFDLVSLSYQMPPIPDPGEDQGPEAQQRFVSQVMQVFDMMQRLESGGPPAIIPPQGEATEDNLMNAKWQAYGPAVFATFLGQRMGLSKAGPNPALLSFTDVLDAARSDDAPAVNKAVKDYHELLTETPLASTKLDKAAAESWLNKFNPTAQGVLVYLVAILLGFSSFLFRSDNLRRATFWILVGVFVIHTIAIVSRIYISGRAPVINLYSSAVFIGWACVLLGLVLEMIYPIGIANLVSAFIGISTLSVARFLDTRDTLHVLEAVLDTQFWLSTHVISVTAGYAVTFLAGFIGICALVHRMATSYDSYPPGSRPKQSEEFQQILYRMIYGIVCFAIFFSFIGTVLGGLWADDSWGRFWGWDPKENGAMMIVLWNAILLHARWDKQVGPRGFAVLAVLGNIVTAWSWFGTNQLGIGLHSYGFTSGALYTLVGFASANLLFVIVSLIVTRAVASGSKNVKV